MGTDIILERPAGHKLVGGFSKNFDKTEVRKYNCKSFNRVEDMVYAIIKSGAKQYRVAVGDKIDVEKLPNKVGDKVTLSNVLMVERDGTVSLGKSIPKGASVLAKVVEEGKSRKVTHFDYRNKHRRRKTHGHRQQFTRLEISEIKV